MSELSKILAYNEKFVESEQYAAFSTSKYPERRLAVLSCMDTRIVELIYAALGVKNGDVKMIRNAGGLVSHPWGSVMRSLLIAVLELRVGEIMVIGHFDCGMKELSADEMLEAAVARGIPPDRIETLRHAGVDLDGWFKGFSDVQESVRQTVRNIRQHPLMPADVAVHGLVIHPATGRLTLVVDGGEAAHG